jgi:glycine cleavage system T protein
LKEKRRIMADKTPLIEVAARFGATFVEENGWLLPAYFGNVAGEYQNARQDTALFDVSHHGKVELTGPDARSFLHNLCTNEVVKLPAGAGCEAFLTSAQAKIIAYVLIFPVVSTEGTETLWLDVGPGMGERVVKHLDRYRISEQVELADRTPEFAQIHLAGPRAAEILEQAAGSKLPELAALHHTSQAVAGVPCQVRRHDPLGVPGYDLLCPREQAEQLWQALVAAGARPAGRRAYHILRIEAGTPIYGVDVDETNLPQEVGRAEQTVSFTKGCYIGQETVARIRTYGHVNRSLVGLKASGSEALPQGTLLFREGKEVGSITSSVLSPGLGTVLALAYVRRGSQEPGTILQVGTEGERGTAEVVSLPFAAPGSAVG